MSGIGGIETWRDAAEFLAVGCRNVQVTTAIMQYGYRIVEDMINGMGHFMEERGYNNLDDFIGCALPNIIPAEDLNRDYKLLPNFDYDKCVGCGRCYVSCYDAAHQAIDWNEEKRRPELNDNCVGCHLCRMYVLYRNVSHRAKSSGKKAEHRQKSASERDTNSIRLTLIYVYRGMGSPYPLYNWQN